jgi:ribonucleoside-diphosphate reductase alpha chain
VGSPFLCFKDTANRANPNDHTGFIRSSNLCTEIFQNTNPNHYLVKIELEDGEILTYEELEEVTLDNGIVKKANKITALDSLKGKKIFIVEKEKIDGDTAVCNLASVNLSKINTKNDIERVLPTAIRMLDNVIDLNFYPLRKVKATNLKTRAIGLGVMGESQMVAESGLVWGSEDHLKKIDQIMEAISYNAISSSSDLAKEKGIYPTFEGSKWSKGIMPMDSAPQAVNALVQRDLFDAGYDWDALREKVKSQGIRNGYLMAIAPTSSISILVGTTQAIEPVYKRKWYEENLSGQIPVVVPNLRPETWNYYTPAYEVEQLDIIKAAAIRQKWIDQGQSTNIFMSLDKASGKYLHQIYTAAWQLGLKSTYYLRSQSPEAVSDVADRSMECIGCQ